MIFKLEFEFLGFDLRFKFKKRLWTHADFLDIELASVLFWKIIFWVKIERICLENLLLNKIIQMT